MYMKLLLCIFLVIFIVKSSPVLFTVLFLLLGLPEICSPFLEKCLKQGYIKHKPDQLTVNQYEPGQGRFLCDSKIFILFYIVV